LEFDLEDVINSDAPGFLTSFKIKTGKKERPFLVAPTNNLNPTHFGLILGRDKPIEIRFKDVPITDINEKVDAIVKKREEEKAKKRYRYKPKTS
jgi:hypothetical protein